MDNTQKIDELTAMMKELASKIDELKIDPGQGAPVACGATDDALVELLGNDSEMPLQSAIRLCGVEPLSLAGGRITNAVKRNKIKSRLVYGRRLVRVADLAEWAIDTDLMRLPRRPGGRPPEQRQQRAKLTGTVDVDVSLRDVPMTLSELAPIVGVSRKCIDIAIRKRQLRPTIGASGVMLATPRAWARRKTQRKPQVRVRFVKKLDGKV